MEYAVEVKDVSKQYGDFRAVKDVSFKISKGICFGILGPNGAGKTSLMSMMEGIRTISSGSIHVLGMDVDKQLNQIQPKMGVQLQTSSYFQFLTVRQLLEFFIALRRANKKTKTNNNFSVMDILEKLALTNKMDVKVNDLSGGQKQRFSIAIAMLEDPEIIFFDEPTTALDPQNRRYTWEFIESIKKDKNKTIILTTHYMEEAEFLCDELLIMDHGKIISQGTPKGLIRELNKSQSIYIKYRNGDFPKNYIDNTVGVDSHERNEDSILVHSQQSVKTLSSLFEYAHTKNIEIIEFDVRLPNLEDVFIANTGVALRDE
ncbi:ATP-binding cassette domain-containing protein [Aliikangiella sp. IMCC44359]|uniref:ATP-binding cassette domain-containing protein n=1 Tax=Aliikangiella sp. IMCC44359 TaxID=3459125 RepID=UPI00403B11A3